MTLHIGFRGILNSTQNLAPNNIWLGITQKMEAKSWQTLEGPLLTFNPSWNSGSSSNQPNNYAYADATLSSKWLSDAVSGLHHVICEYRIGYNPSIDNSKFVCLGITIYFKYNLTQCVLLQPHVYQI